MTDIQGPEDFLQRGRVETFPPKPNTHEVNAGTKQCELNDNPPNDGGEARLIQSSRDFVANFVPPDYLVDGILQRRFIYSLTAPTGAGKTAIALLLSAHVPLGRLIGERRVERGRVLYFAGENPDDIRMRWIAMADNMGFNLDEIDVHFIPGTFSIPRLMKRIREETTAFFTAAPVMP